MTPENPRTTGALANDHDIRVWHNIHYATSTPETKPNAWMAFHNQQDPYNPDNFLTGWVQMTGGNEYGTLQIASVNERPVPQRILTTPKTAYPYRRDRAWLLQSAASIRSAPKYDGTNICQYSYRDADGNRFTSFKLRTRPFVAPFFRVLLDRTLRNYPNVAELKLQDHEAMLYELYGRQNHLLIEYPHDIDLMALCRRNPEDGDMQPADPDDPMFNRLDCPIALLSPPSQWLDIRAEYQRRQTFHSANLTETKVDGERAFRGHEGEMLYVTFSDGSRDLPGPFTRLIKLKPPEIEEIHQSSDHVPKEEIQATARNLWETDDHPELRHLITLLQEDWSDDQIKRSTETITAVLTEVLQKRQYEDEILETFHHNFEDQDFRTDRPAVMRRLANLLPRSAMQQAYTILDRRIP